MGYRAVRLVRSGESQLQPHPVEPSPEEEDRAVDGDCLIRLDTIGETSAGRLAALQRGVERLLAAQPPAALRRYAEKQQVAVERERGPESAFCCCVPT